MDKRTTGPCIVLVLALGAAVASAHSPPPPPPPDVSADEDAIDADDAHDAYTQARRDLYDALRNDSSPRVQVLAGRIYLSDDDVTPSALRPKREDVVARAAQLAPDDAFVQWMAADQGSYASSQCGPTRWPEAEVANLVRLEGDNAGAWQFAVALAHAKGDQAALDDALARMAAAPRADDHLGEEVATWRKAHAAHPSPGMMDGLWNNAEATPEARALLRTLQETAYRYSSTTATLEAVCKPDAQSERAWQRLGWCVDAGRLLATRGNSFALREQGLKLLAASGAGGDEAAELQRQFDWLKTHAANPMQNPAAFEDAPADVVADWRGAANEIVAAEHRLTRLGQPSTPPAGWVAKTDAVDYDDASDKTARTAGLAYLRAVITDMRHSADARERAAGLAIDTTRLGWNEDEQDGGSAAAVPQDPSGADTALVDLAAAHPDDLFVQWTAAIAKGDDAAIARAQRLEPDNAAVWTLAMESAPGSANILHRAAGAKRFDDHSAEAIALLHVAFRRQPLPVDLQAQWLDGDAAQAQDPEKVRAFTSAMALAMANLRIAPASNLLQACQPDRVESDASAMADCTTVARLMLNSSTSLLVAMFGEAALRKLGTLDAADRERARQIAWWRTQVGATNEDQERYIDDYFATGSEIEAIRLALTRAGKAEPPVGWKSPAEKHAAKGN